MCGITGIFDMKGENRIRPEIMDNMIQAVAHRGPDGQDRYMDSRVGLGFVRLSFLDPEGGMQPITNETSDLVLVCNGEIFNFLELRKELEGRGHRFRTEVDVEVILHLYEEYGTDAVKRLNGQFAFVIYDRRDRSIFCARDHVGIAPFFYTVYDGFFIFASEIKAILQYPGITGRLNMHAVDQLLTFPGCRAPNTFFKDIYTLENGHFMKFCTAKSIRQQEYWDVRYPEITEDRGEDYYAESLLERIEQAVKIRLHAQVPIGFYISGGLDSSVIAGLKNRSARTPYHSFSIDFADRSVSESRFQRCVQRNVKSLHHKKLFTQQDMARYFKPVIYHGETPLRETYNTASMALSEMVHETGVKAVLTGEGADEFFSGYVGYKFDAARKKERGMILTDEEKAVNDVVYGDPDFFYERSLTELENIKPQIYSKDVGASLKEFTAVGRPVLKPGVIRNLDEQQKRSYADYKLRLPEHLLADHGDRMTFANAIEARYPFLDINVLDLAVRMPSRYKLDSSLNEKYIVKKMARGIVPDEIISRTKFAFVAPGVSELLKCKDEYVETLLSEKSIKGQGIFNWDYVEALKRRYQTEGFRLNLPFDTDYLIIVLTVSAFCDIFDLSL